MNAQLLAILLFFSLMQPAWAQDEDPRKIMHTLFVFSDPPLSEIYVDGVKQQAPTPAVVRIPANATPLIEVKHEGHEAFRKKVNSRGSGSKLNAQLKKIQEEK